MRPPETAAAKTKNIGSKDSLFPRVGQGAGFRRAREGVLLMTPYPEPRQEQEPSDIPFDEMASPPNAPTNKKRSKGKKPRYAKLSVELWDNPDFYKLGAEAKYLYTALHFGRSSNMSGLFPVTRRMLKDFGLSKEQYERALLELEETELVSVERYSDDDDMIFVPAILRQDFDSPPQAIGALRASNAYFYSKLREDFMSEWGRLVTERFADRLDDVISLDGRETTMRKILREAR